MIIVYAIVGAVLFITNILSSIFYLEHFIGSVLGGAKPSLTWYQWVLLTIFGTVPTLVIFMIWIATCIMSIMDNQK